MLALHPAAFVTAPNRFSNRCQPLLIYDVLLCLSSESPLGSLSAQQASLQQQLQQIMRQQELLNQRSAALERQQAEKLQSKREASDTRHLNTCQLSYSNP